MVVHNCLYINMRLANLILDFLYVFLYQFKNIKIPMHPLFFLKLNVDIIDYSKGTKRILFKYYVESCYFGVNKKF